MEWFTFVLVYAFIWWILFFMALPFGIRRVENPDEMHDAGAPEKPYLWPKAIIVTVMAIPVTWLAITFFNQELKETREEAWQAPAPGVIQDMTNP